MTTYAASKRQEYIDYETRSMQTDNNQTKTNNSLTLQEHFQNSKNILKQ